LEAGPAAGRPVNAMMRYIRLYWNFIKFSLTRAMFFRMDFCFRIVMDTLFYAVQMAFFLVIFRHTNAMGGWTLDQTLIFACSFFVIDALHMTMFSNNMWWLPNIVNKGDLDYYLVRPVSSLFFVTLRDFAANSFINLVIATSLLVAVMVRYDGPLEPMNVFLFFATLFWGSLIYAGLHICFLIPVFWLHSNRGLGELFYQTEKIAAKPDQVFTGWMRRTILTILPFALVASFPTHILFEGLSLKVAMHFVVVSVTLFAFVVWFWQRGLRSYTSASS